MLLASRLCTPVCRRHRHAPQAFGSAAMLLHDGSSLFVLRVAFVFIALDRSGSSSSLSYSFAYLLHTSHLRRYYCLFLYLSIIIFSFLLCLSSFFTTFVHADVLIILHIHRNPHDPHNNKDERPELACPSLRPCYMLCLPHRGQAWIKADGTRQHRRAQKKPM